MATGVAPGVHPKYAAADGDVVLVSSDNVKFKVHSLILREASTVFEGMVNMPAPQPDGAGNSSDHEVKLEEPSFVVESLMDAIYPRETLPTVSNYAQAWEIAKAADKYMIGRALSILQAIILQNEELRKQTLRLYKLARRYQWTDVIASSSRASLDKPLLNFLYMDLETQEQFFELSKEDAEDLLRLHKDRIIDILNFDAQTMTKFDCDTDVYGEDTEEGPKLLTIWRCPARTINGCPGYGDPERIDAALISFKNEVERYLSQNPAAPGLFQREAFGEKFKEFVRTSGFEWIKCNSCKKPFADEEIAWEYLQHVESLIPNTVFETIQPD
ncbi:hypothetical protein SCHPADRAFT_999218 [Schizopora paradoxa]|uniref:BTB domain-containing protein n=1 Tax=Schizopora paradoxa TaxID=27342 RepID=A0A0H2RGK2_9AGAM|nr:hypothetical protein SCHPADRAFT_999218 [Schizopora paradoxa]